MTSRGTVTLFFPMLQLLVSILLAGTILWGYVAFRAPLASTLDALTNSITSVANVIEGTAGTIGMRTELIDSTRQTLAQTRAAIELSSKAIAAQASEAPKRAEELKSASQLILRSSDILNNLANGLLQFSAPAGIDFNNGKPIVVMKRPLATFGNDLQPIAQEMRTLGEGVQHLSKTVAADGAKLAEAFSQLGAQTIQMLNESEQTLERIRDQDLPRSAKEMRDAAEHLRTATKELTAISDNLGITFLAAGLLFSAWLLLNSINTIVLARRLGSE